MEQAEIAAQEEGETPLRAYTNTQTGQIYHQTPRWRPHVNLAGERIALQVWLTHCAHCGVEFEVLVSGRAEHTNALFSRRGCPKHKGKKTPEGRKKCRQASRATAAKAKAQAKIRKTQQGEAE